MTSTAMHRTNDYRLVEILDVLPAGSDYSDAFLVIEIRRGRRVGFPFQVSTMRGEDGHLVMYPIDVLVGCE